MVANDFTDPARQQKTLLTRKYRLSRLSDRFATGQWRYCTEEAES